MEGGGVAVPQPKRTVEEGFRVCLNLAMSLSFWLFYNFFPFEETVCRSPVTILSVLLLFSRFNAVLSFCFFLLVLQLLAKVLQYGFSNNPRNLKWRFERIER